MTFAGKLSELASRITTEAMADDALTFPQDDALNLAAVLSEAAETITTLHAKLEAAERDAVRYRQDHARYRHLRDWSRGNLCVRQRESYDSFTWLSGASLDHATDAAIAEVDAAANQGEG